MTEQRHEVGVQPSEQLATGDQVQGTPTSAIVVRPRPAARKGSCGATTRAGAPCPANAMSGSLPPRCFHHSSNAEVAERRTLARQMGGLRATQRKLGADLPVDLASRDGVRLLLESAITAVSKGQLTPTQGTAINQLALTALRMRELESEVALIDAQKLALEIKARGRTMILEDSGNGTPRA